VFNHGVCDGDAVATVFIKFGEFSIARSCLIESDVFFSGVEVNDCRKNNVLVCVAFSTYRILGTGRVDEVQWANGIPSDHGATHCHDTLGERAIGCGAFLGHEWTLAYHCDRVDRYEFSRQDVDQLKNTRHTGTMRTLSGSFSYVFLWGKRTGIRSDDLQRDDVNFDTGKAQV